jgi:hypothetical protein
VKSRIAVLVLLAWSAALRLDAAAAEDKPVQFILIGTASMGPDFHGEFGGHVGPGARIDLALGKEIMITSEAVYDVYWDSIAAAATLDLKIGKWAYVGAGPLVSWATFDGQPVAAFKARLGMKGRHLLFELHCVMAKASAHTWGADVRLFGLTFGWVFR